MLVLKIFGLKTDDHQIIQDHEENFDRIMSPNKLLLFAKEDDFGIVVSMKDRY